MIFKDHLMPIEAVPEFKKLRNIICWCSNRSGSRALSISSKSLGVFNYKGFLELNSYDIYFPGQSYAKKVLSFISTL